MRKINVSNFADYDGALAEARAVFAECDSVQKKAAQFSLLLSVGIDVPTLAARAAVVRVRFPAVIITPDISDTETLNERKWRRGQELSRWYQGQQLLTHTDGNGDERGLDLPTALLHFAQLISRQHITRDSDSAELPVVNADGRTVNRSQGVVRTGMAEYFSAWEALHLSYVAANRNIISAPDMAALDMINIPPA